MMNIEIKNKDEIPEHLLESIEQRLSTFLSAPERLREDYLKKLEIANNKITEVKKFWENNTLPIYDYISEYDRMNSMKENDLYIVDHFYKTWDALNVSTWEKQKGWACFHCKREPIMRYITCSDSRYDDNYRCCDCEGARKNGIKWTTFRDNNN